MEKNLLSDDTDSARSTEKEKSAERTLSEKLRKWNKGRKADIQRSPKKVSELSVYKCNKPNKRTRETERPRDNSNGIRLITPSMNISRYLLYDT